MCKANERAEILFFKINVYKNGATIWLLRVYKM